MLEKSLNPNIVKTTMLIAGMLAVFVLISCETECHWRCPSLFGFWCRGSSKWLWADPGDSWRTEGNTIQGNIPKVSTNEYWIVFREKQDVTTMWVCHIVVTFSFIYNCWNWNWIKLYINAIRGLRKMHNHYSQVSILWQCYIPVTCKKSEIRIGWKTVWLTNV